MKCIFRKSLCVVSHDQYFGASTIRAIAEKLTSIIPLIGALLLLLAFSPQQANAQNEIKIGSYNIRVETTDDGVNNWPYRKDNVVDLIKIKHALDIFGAQEDENGPVNYLKSNLPGFDFVGRGAYASPTSGEYNAIFYRTSRFQLLQQQTRWLSTTPTVAGSISWGAIYPRTVTQAKFKDLQTNVEFWVFNTHFEHAAGGQTARINSAALVKQWILDVGSIPVILTGDFNAQPTTTEMQTILNTPLSNSISITETAHQGHAATFGMSSGWTSISGSSVIDYIFVNSGIRVLSHRHATDQYMLSGAMRFPSDHLPVIASVILPSSGGAPTTVTLKNGLNGYNGNVSFAVSGQTPTSNLTSNDYKHVTNTLPGTNGYVNRAFYKFDLSQIPAGSTITSATLQLDVDYSGGSADGGIKIHRMKPVNNAFTVNYATATRNTYNGSTGWTGGANAAGDVANSNNDYLDTPDSTTTLPAEGASGSISFNVTTSVQAWVNGEANNGWLVLPTARTVYLCTANDLHGSNDFPVLTVTYQGAPPQSVSKTLKNGVNGYTGGSSFHVSGQLPTSNFGASGYSHISDNRAATNGYMYRTFYKFDVSPAASGIPAGAVIESARLKAKLELLSATNTYGISCYRVAPVGGAFAVNYGTATKNTYNGTNAWTGGANAGGDVADSNNDFIDTPLSNIPIPAVGTWLDFDVTSAVQTWVNGTANNGLIVRPNDGADYVNVRMGTTSDLHGSAENAILEVTYH